MQRFIIEANIQRYDEMLRRELDEAQRRLIEGLLLEEKEKLAALAKASRANQA